MSFYCPHLDEPNDWCAKLNTDCVPGRRGCVLRGKVQFLEDPDDRVERRRRERERHDARHKMNTLGDA